MADPTQIGPTPTGRPITTLPADARSGETAASGVTWPAVFAGAFVAIAVSLALLILGSAFGLATASPWERAGASAAAIGAGAAIWLIVVQWLASGLGGYLAGRLRTKWVGIHTDEVFFRDTAHGFLVWAVATVVTFGLLTSAVASLAGAGTQATATLAAGAVKTVAEASDPNAYFVDTLFRSNRVSAEDRSHDVRAETTRLLLTGLSAGELSTADKSYLVQLVAGQTGLTHAEAEKRVDTVMAQAKDAAQKAKEAADAARKAAAGLALITFLALLVGAFIASVTAALGGRERDS